MDKKTFIAALKNGAIPSSKNQSDFTTIATEEFQPFNKDLVEINEQCHRWTDTYFIELIEQITHFSFSKELILHTIEVKKYLQEKGILKVAQIETQKIEKSAVENSQEKDTLSESEGIKSTIFDKKINIGDFQASEYLLKLLKENNITGIRSDLMSTLNNRRIPLEQVLKTIYYVYQHKIEVFEEAENSAFVQPIDNTETNWNIDYFSKQQVYLNRNFTLERLLHLFNVRETLMKKGDSNFQQINVERRKVEPLKTTTAQQEQKTTQSPNSQENYTHRTTNEYGQSREENKNSDNAFIKTALVVGGAVLAVLGAIFLLIK